MHPFKSYRLDTKRVTMLTTPMQTGSLCVKHASQATKLECHDSIILKGMSYIMFDDGWIQLDLDFLEYNQLLKIRFLGLPQLQ